MINDDIAQASRNTTYKRVYISEVNSLKMHIEGVDNLNSPFRIDWQFQDSLTRVPQVGEEWIIGQFNNLWKLMWRVEKGDESMPLTFLGPGDVRIHGNHIWIEGDIFINQRRLVPKETVYNQTPSGVIDGSNKDFWTLSAYINGTLRVYLNGLRTTEFTETGQTTFEMNTPPLVDDELMVDYDFDPSTLNFGSQEDGELI
jgi:hypothetical protein